MIIGLYIIGTTFSLVLMWVRLCDANREVQRLCGERDTIEKAEYIAYRQGVTLSIACLLAGLAAASFYAPRSRAGAGND